MALCNTPYGTSANKWSATKQIYSNMCPTPWHDFNQACAIREKRAMYDNIVQYYNDNRTIVFGDIGRLIFLCE